MSGLDRWRLPDGVEELLPAEVVKIEALRRKLLDLFHCWGYETVIPPLIEYLESLLTGTGNDLDLQTFKLTDQLTGRMMGVRADMTPQVARIDAHRLNRDGPTRLCYLGSVLHTRPEISGATRSPIQLGAELYGHSGVESDVEVVLLMVEMLIASGEKSLVLDLGHVGIYRSLIKQVVFDSDQERMLFDALQRKASAEVEDIVRSALPDSADKVIAEQLIALKDLNGGDEVLKRAEKMDSSIQPSVATLQKIAVLVQEQLADRVGTEDFKLEIHFDLAELRGYDYHTGVVFAAYAEGKGVALAQGGRYDNVGAVFGRARAATGFSADLKNLISNNLEADNVEYPLPAIFAPHLDEATSSVVRQELRRKIESLRSSGERVICELLGQREGAADIGCDRKLVESDGSWSVTKR
jgi:ATP phosphoribosyltransferase regulatory subunit